MSSADSIQHGGHHYKKGGAIQHWNMALRNGLGYLEAAATKYVTRWQDKGGLLDVEKVGHYLDKLIEEAEAGRAFPVQAYRHTAPVRRRPRVDMGEYAAANCLGKLEDSFCRLVVAWADTANINHLYAAREVHHELMAYATLWANKGFTEHHQV